MRAYAAGAREGDDILKRVLEVKKGAHFLIPIFRQIVGGGEQFTL